MLLHVLTGLWVGLPMMTNPAAVVPPTGAIQPLHADYAYHRPKPGEAVSFTTYLLSASGATLYKFECHGGDWPDESEMKFDGDFQCALFPINGDTLTPVNLLARDTREEQGADWKNRGRAMVKQFQDECLDYPEYSTLRHFRLRGMALALGYTDLVWDGKTLASFSFHLDAMPDAEAKTSFADAADGDRPSSSCYPGDKPHK
jgi:hypothetical protein